MAICYELEELRPTQIGDHMSSLVKVSSTEPSTCARPTVAVVSREEFERLGLEERGAHESLAELAASESNYVDIYPDYIVGSIAVPSKGSLADPPSLFAFYLDSHLLIFVDEGGTAEAALERIMDMGVLAASSTAHCLYIFFKELLVDDLSFLGEFEDRMEAIEEQMLDVSSGIRTNTIMEYRRQSMRFGVYYQEIATMASVLSDNENKLMDKRESLAFDHIEHLADRLARRSETLKEYSLQLHELHQTRIDLKQNSTMQIFTIVTVLFAPLTLVTGWFGMNLQMLPGLDWPFMWATLIIAALICTSALLVFFRWKRWL